MATEDARRMSASHRLALVQAASIEFARAGYEHASLNRIIRECGLSKSSFYHLIASKRELFDLVVRELTASVAGRIAIPAPEEFAGAAFWNVAERFLDRLTAAAATDESFLALGRIFYASTAPDAASEPLAETLAGVRTWLEQVLRIGRRDGAVRTDIPVELQSHLLFGILRILDEWSVAHAADLDASAAAELMRVQFQLIRRLLR
jgi:AcrR family transcriptional regulator